MIEDNAVGEGGGGMLPQSHQSQVSPNSTILVHTGSWVELGFNDSRKEEKYQRGHTDSSSEESLKIEAAVKTNLKSGHTYDDLEQEATHDLEPIASCKDYVESVDPVKKLICCDRFDPDAVCCFTTNRTKRIIIVVAFLTSALLIVFFGFAIAPVPYRAKPVLALTSSAATTTGSIKVLLLGNLH